MSGSSGAAWSCGSRSWNAACRWTAATRGRVLEGADRGEEARRARQESERERRKDRKRGGQPGHQGKGLKRDPGPDRTQTAEPPAECRSCHASLDGAEAADPRWAQVIDIGILRKVTEYLLPGLSCGGCGTVTFAAAPPGFHAGSVTYGPVELCTQMRPTPSG